jgi:hypothetical protein
MKDSLSPEDILRQKEIKGGVKYDNPTDAPVTDVEDLGDVSNVYQRDSEKLDTNNIPPNLGNANPTPIEPAVGVNVNSMELGWKNLPVSMLPSGGMFYPEGAKIAIRPAEVREIRLFSTIDEGDMVDLDTKLNFILESCSRVKFSQAGAVSYLDLKKEDRFFIIMAIRDLTFVKGENRIIIKPRKKCTTKGCEGIEAIELRTGVLNSYELDPRLMEYYSSTDRAFVFNIRRLNKRIRMTIPSIGISNIISDWVTRMVKSGRDVDESFIKIAPFYFDDWRSLNDNVINETMIESNNWSKEEFSMYFQLADMIKVGTNLDVKIKCDKCSDGEVTAPIYFPDGFRSLFVISDIFGELLGS